jgi:hypothetical protein
VLCDAAGVEAFVPGAPPPTLPWFASFTVATDDGNAAAREIFERNRVSFNSIGERLILAPETACGTACIFTPLPQ